MKSFLENELGTTDGTLNYSGNTGVSGKAFGYDYFKCDDSTFSKCLKGRAKNKRWKNFVGDKKLSDNVRQYIKSNKGAKFLFQNERTKEFMFVDQKFYN